MGKRRSRKEWREIVHRWEGSGQSMPVFAREQGLNLETLRFWKYALKMGAEPAFLELAVRQTPPIQVVLASGIRVEVPEGANLQQIRAVVEALA